MPYRKRGGLYYPLITITIRERCIMLSSKTMWCLGAANHVNVYFSPNTKELILVTCPSDDEHAIEIKRRRQNSSVICNTRLAEKIRKDAGLTGTVKFVGKFVPEYNGIAFPLDDPKEPGFGKRDQQKI